MDFNKEIYPIILENMCDAVYVLDDKGNFIYVNKALVKLSGYSKKKFLEWNVFQLKNDGLISECVSKIVYTEKKEKTILQQIWHKNQFIKNVLVTSTPIFDENGNVKNLVAIQRDLETTNRYVDQAKKSDIVGIINIAKDDSKVQSRQNIVASSGKMIDLLNRVEYMAKVDATILIQGESGTGKEVIANLIHTSSSRKDKKMITVNCASLPENLLEAELFGYEKGAYTGAYKEGKKGLIELAENGTLFLDELNSLPFKLQGKLLRVIETKEVKKIGSTKIKYIDFRLLTATNADLKIMVKNNLFRQDLFYRINVLPVTIPPLRERREDIVPLARYFLKYYTEKYNIEKKLSQNVYNLMLEYDWSGNVRELKNFIERLIVTSATSVVEVKNITKDMFDNCEEEKINNSNKKENPDIIENHSFGMVGDKSYSLKESIEKVEYYLIKDALCRYGSTYKAAEALKVNQSTIARKKIKYGIGKYVK